MQKRPTGWVSSSPSTANTCGQDRREARLVVGSIVHPIVNIVIWIIVTLAIGKAFGKSTAFSIFLLMIFGCNRVSNLGYGSAVYTPAHATAPAPAA